MTKYAVLSYDTPYKNGNIGDDIQSLASIHMLRKNNIHEYICISREKLKSYTGEPVHLIMNGWFMQDFTQFPPSENITPVFIGFHCAKEKLVKNNIEYFKRFEPIGCRDTHTKRIFEKYNINAYFSGCLTLAFNETINKNELIYNVDINTNCTYVPNVNIDMSLYTDTTIIEHDCQQWDVQKRFNRANELLDIYKSAKLILTTRLHCVLPCRAFGTNVLFIHKHYNTNPRFTGLKKYINGIDDTVKNFVLDKMTIQKELIINIKAQLNNTFTNLIT